MIYGFFYRLVMRITHHYNWHYAPPIYPDGDTQLWCQWCGFRQTIKRRPTTGAVDGGDSPAQIALSTPPQSLVKQVLSKLTHHH